MHKVYLGLGGAALTLLIVLFVFEISKHGQGFTSKELEQIKKLQVILSDPLDCTLSLTGKKRSGLLENLRECPLEGRQFDPFKNSFICSKIAEEKKTSSYFELLDVSWGEQINEGGSLKLIVKGKESHSKMILSLGITLRADGLIDSCHPQMNKNFDQLKKEIDNYPGAKAIEL